MEKLTDFFPYKNSAKLDIERPLKWANETILRTIEYYQSVCHETTDYDAIIAELRNGSLRPIQALLFGALKAADPKMNTKRFSQIYKPHYLAEYVTAVMDGMANYFADSDMKDTGDDLDPEWPDTQAEVKKKTLRPTGGSGSGSVRKTASRVRNFSSRQ
jgi:hypothetical protein